MVIEKHRKGCMNTASFKFVLYSLFTLILLVLLILSLFTTEITLGIPNVNYPQPIVNHRPLVRVGPDQMVKENEMVILRGIANDLDPGDKISYSWRQIAGPVAKLSHSNTMNPSFIAPNVSADTQMRFALTVTDNKGATSISPAIVTITIKHINHAPIANAGTDQTVSPGYVTTLDGTSSNDPDNDPLTYIWVQTGGPYVPIKSCQYIHCYIYSSF